MKRMIAIAAASLAVALTVFGCAGEPGGSGWVTLIDGEKGLDNFNRIGDANWRGEGGAIVADKATTKGASLLVSKQSYKDLEIYAEFWASEDTNSGVYLRAPDPNVVNTASGAFEVQIWDKNPNQLYRTGSLVNVATAQPIYKAANKWNTFEIYARGSQITVKMNGTVTSTTDYAKTHEGRVALQFNPGTGVVKFRKLMVRPL
jgi:3-keto-disaccharide hydrolase